MHYNGPKIFLCALGNDLIERLNGKFDQKFIRILNSLQGAQKDDHLYQLRLDQRSGTTRNDRAEGIYYRDLTFYNAEAGSMASGRRLLCVSKTNGKPAGIWEGRMDALEVREREGEGNP